MADDERGRRVLSDINLAFTRDAEIDEFGFIPCPEALQNKSPVILERHKLGIESWSVPLVYQYAYTRLVQTRQKLIRPEQKELINITRAVLLINPECYTAWNIRKELVDAGYLHVAADLQFSSLALTRKPKSPETFAHRKWLLQELLRQKNNSRNTSNVENGLHNDYRELQVCVDVFKVDEEIIQKEFEVCTHSAKRYSNNYSAWSHRIWVIQHLTICPQQLLLAELSQTTSIVSMHISDHSGFHYRQFLIHEYYKQHMNNTHPAISTSKMKALLDTEMSFTAELIEAYPGHEAIWSNRRYLFYLLCHLPSDESQQNKVLVDTGIKEQTTNGWQHHDHQKSNTESPRLQSSTDNAAFNIQVNLQGKKFRADNSHKQTDLQQFIDIELGFVDCCLANTLLADFSAQSRCAEAYKKWLHFMLKL